MSKRNMTLDDILRGTAFNPVEPAAEGNETTSTSDIDSGIPGPYGLEEQSFDDLFEQLQMLDHVQRKLASAVSESSKVLSVLCGIHNYDERHELWNGLASLVVVYQTLGLRFDELFHLAFSKQE